MQNVQKNIVHVDETISTYTSLKTWQITDEF